LANPKSQNPFYEIQKRDLKEYIIKGFSRQEQLIFILYYFEEMTMREIGDTLGISESRVCQLHSSIVQRLKAKLKEEKLLSY
jgi:RNA polymerase sigma factor for flagellar operon FliA